MARVIWTGALAFGLVNIPVGLYSATEDRTVHFNQFQQGTSDRIRYKRVNERTGEKVNYRDIVEGREVDDDTYVLLTDEDLESVEPGRTRTIDITDFVDLSEVDPIYFQRTYTGAAGPRRGPFLRPAAPGHGGNEPGRDRHPRHAEQEYRPRCGPRRRSWPWRRCTSPTRSGSRSRPPGTSRPASPPSPGNSPSRSS